MSVDLNQFLQTFFEESFEGLDTMEAGLLSLDPEQPDVEVLHNVFRAAHSIKGGAGTFGLTAISDFTHRMETLLDRLRDGEQPVTAEGINTLLNAVDCLRGMLEAIQGDQELDSAALSDAQGQLDQELAGGGASGGSGGPGAQASQDAGQGGAGADGDGSGGSGEGGGGGHQGWWIRFEPEPHLFATGNDPRRLFLALNDLGELSVECDTSQLAPFEQLDPETCQLSWTLRLYAGCDEAAVREVFEWVEEDARLEIQPLQAPEEGGAEAAESAAPGPAEAQGQAAAGGAAQGAAGAAGGKRGAGRAVSGGSGTGSSIRVDTEKVDDLIDMVGELVITQSMLSQIGKEFSQDRLEELQDGLAQLERNTRELQEKVMRIRMVPISFAYSRLPRIVHDTSRGLGKAVDFQMEGEQTELDKTVMEKIIDPLVHLVRNSVDHGIEAPEERRAAGKPETGQVTIDAYHKGGNIIIEIRDDGRGINRDKLLAKARSSGIVEDGSELSDEQAYDLIFHPGLSTHDEATEYSGRGVGMDVVKRNIRALSGNIYVRSTHGQGTTITISLPLTLSILDGQLFRVGEQTYIVPLVSVIESLQVDAKKVSRLSGRGEVYHWREGYVPIVRLHELFGTEPERSELDGGLMVIVEDEEAYLGLFVDDLLDQQQVVIKSLEANYLQVPGIAGATILGDGTVSLILDIAGLIDMSRGGRRHPYVPEREDADEAA